MGGLFGRDVQGTFSAAIMKHLSPYNLQRTKFYGSGVQKSQIKSVVGLFSWQSPVFVYCHDRVSLHDGALNISSTGEEESILPDRSLPPECQD